VHWQCDDQPKELNFFSVSSDGRVANWIMSKNELKMEAVMQMKLTSSTTSNSAAAITNGSAAAAAAAGDNCYHYLHLDT
jgi:dynein intermediate chain 1, axonemal